MNSDHEFWLYSDNGIFVGACRSYWMRPIPAEGTGYIQEDIIGQITHNEVPATYAEYLEFVEGFTDYDYLSEKQHYWGDRYGPFGYYCRIGLVQLTAASRIEPITVLESPWVDELWGARSAIAKRVSIDRYTFLEQAVMFVEQESERRSHVVALAT